MNAYQAFYIDFGSSRHMPSGPESGAVIHDYKRMGGHFPPPEGTDALDPYAYDIYSMGATILDVCTVRDVLVLRPGLIYGNAL